MKKHTIHIVNRFFYPVTAGIENTLLEILRHFDKAKYSITVHVSANTLSKENILSLHGKKDKITIYRYKTFLRQFFFPFLPFRSMHVLFLTNFTLVPHVIVLMQIAYKKLFANKQFTFIFFPCGGFTPDWQSFPFMQRVIKQLVHKTVGNLLINYASNKVIAISSWEKTELIKQGIKPSLITVISLGVEDKAYTRVNRKKISPKIKKIVRHASPYIIQVARIHPIKNMETTIEAISRMKKPLSYLLVGEVESKPYKQQLYDLMKRKKISQKIFFTGKVNMTEKYFLIDKSLCMVHMSYNEAFGLSVYEAMCRGKLCIVARNSALLDAVRNDKNGYVLNTKDAKGLARKLSLLQSPKSKRIIQNMKMINVERMQEYRWKNVAKKIKNILYA